MTFQAYLDAIREKTGKTPDELRVAAEKAGVYSRTMTATTLVEWLNRDYGLGRGHAMAVWAVFKGKGWVDGPERKRKT